MKGLLYLALAIVSEVFGSTMLKLSEGFTQAWPIGGVIAGFLSAFTFLSFSLKTIDLSSAYATWSGVGTALTAIVGFLLFGETISLKGVFGLTLVIAGVVVLNQSKAPAKEKNRRSVSDRLFFILQPVLQRLQAAARHFLELRVKSCMTTPPFHKVCVPMRHLLVKHHV